MSKAICNAHRLAYLFVLAIIAGGIVGCETTETTEDEPYTGVFPVKGEIERVSPTLDELIPPGAQMEVIAEGFDWSEGPLWVPHDGTPGGGFLLFSDIPPNRVYKWRLSGDPENIAPHVDVYLDPSGYDGPIPRSNHIAPDEPGSNGLTLDPKGRLVLMQHGNRQVARMAASIDSPMSEWFPIAQRYMGERLNSPNDGVYGPGHGLYFTDPPYGLTRKMQDEWKKLDFQGVYRVSKYGHVRLLTKEMTRPNGIAFSPDYKKLYVANSDPKMAIWKWFPVKWDGTLGEGHVLFDATDRVGMYKGLPDGMAVDVHGNIFATGPGGVLVFNPQGEHLGTLMTGEATSNCTFGGPDGATLFITADSYILRIQTSTTGAVVGAPRNLPPIASEPSLDWTVPGPVGAASHCPICDGEAGMCNKCAAMISKCEMCAKSDKGMCDKCVKKCASCPDCAAAKKMGKCQKCAAHVMKCKKCAKSKTGLCEKCAEMCAKCTECAKLAAGHCPACDKPTN